MYTALYSGHDSRITKQNRLQQLVMMANILLVLLSACLLFSCKHCRESAIQEPGPERLIFTAELGPVSFPHRSHLQQIKNGCIQCHHKGSETDHHCRNCHKRKIETKEGDAVAFFDVKMNLCRGCHQQLRDNETSARAPIHCNECHDVKKINWSKP
jgi:predicted transposase YbfD/YdcC